MDHNLIYRDLIFVIQKPNLKFTIEGTISKKNTSLNSLFSNQKSALKFGHHIVSKQALLPQPKNFAKQLFREKTQPNSPLG